jgi:predicted RNA binding protein YcfA (HicA-like mRNA interferase family)
MPLSSLNLIRLIESDGWFHVQTRGSHQQFKHPTKSGKVTIPHGKKDLIVKKTCQ